LHFFSENIIDIYNSTSNKEFVENDTNRHNSTSNEEFVENDTNIHNSTSNEEFVENDTNRHNSTSNEEFVKNDINTHDSTSNKEIDHVYSETEVNTLHNAKYDIKINTERKTHLQEVNYEKGYNLRVKCHKEETNC